MTQPRKAAGKARASGDLSTRAIHAGSAWNRTTAISPPIFQTTTFRLEEAAQGAEFAGAVAPGEFYTRWGNPTLKQVEAVMASLEGAEAALVFSSGMGALSSALLSLLSSGDHLVLGRSIYSGVHELATGIFPRYGIEASFADSSDCGELARAVRPNTKLILVESPTNPTLQICDLQALGELGRERGVLTIVDNTFATPCNQNPLAFGVDIVVHAATKYLGGHSDVTSGVICSRQEIVDGCWRFLKLLGACMSPFEAWLLARGLKTLPLRVERQSRTALKLARFLNARPEVERVYYPGLESHPGHLLAGRQMRAFGGIISFELGGGIRGAARFVESLELIQLAVSLGGAESIIQHPASMSHGTLSDEDLGEAGISPGLVRLSVGLEAEEDLRRDLQRSLEKFAGD